MLNINPIIDNASVDSPDKTVFVIMPFSSTSKHEESDWTEIFNFVFKPAVEECGYCCERAEITTGNLIRSIVDRLKTSPIVLADITDNNPNVFYELGVRHALCQGTIIAAQSSEDIPSDLRGYWTLIYGTSPGQVVQFRKNLKNIIRQIEDNPKKSDSPVSDFLKSQNLENEGFVEVLMVRFSNEFKQIKSDIVNDLLKSLPSR